MTRRICAREERRAAHVLGAGITALLAFARPLAAQVAPAAPPPPVPALGPAADGAVRLRPVIFPGKPRSLEVVSIPVPDVIAPNAPATYVVRDAGGARLYGIQRGALGAGAGRPTALHITVGLPGVGVAGRVLVAVVRFEATGIGALEIPVECDVAAVREFDAATLDNLTGMRLGQWARLRFTVRNGGNVVDSVIAEPMLPARWKVRGPKATLLTLQPREQRTHELWVWAPFDAPPGLSSVVLNVRRHATVVASAEAHVQVQDGHGGTGDGARVTLGVAQALGAPVGAAGGSGSLAGYTLAVDGPLTDKVQVSARAAYVPLTVGGAEYALSRAGVMRTPVALSLTSAKWTAGAGMTSATLSPLAGTSVSGRGASVDYHADGWAGSVIAAVPYFNAFGASADSTDSGLLVGGRVQHALGSGDLFLAASHFDEPFSRRQLDAATGGVMTQIPMVGTLRSEVGYRAFDGGAGLGWSGELTRTGERTFYSLRAAEAPGGSAAFASAVAERAASGGVALTPWLRVNGSYWGTRDANRLFGALRNSGWEGGASLRLASAADLTVERRSFGYTAINPIGSVGQQSDLWSGSLSARLWLLTLAGSVSTGREVRTASVSGAGLPPGEGTRTDWRGTVTLPTSVGMFGIGGTVQSSPGAAGVLPGQRTFEAHATRVSVPILSRYGVLADADVQQTAVALAPAPVTALRAAISAPLVAGLRVAVGAERNPLFMASTTGRGASPVWTVRLERSLTLPRFGNSASSGTVYDDVDGDGRKEPSEPGVANIVVRCGLSVTVVTDQRGHYHCPGGTGTATVDAESVPVGLLLPASSQAGPAVRDVGLLTIAEVRVAVQLVETDTIRVPASELAKVVVLARDARGRAWLARSVDAGHARFDALPPGHYTLDVDVSAVREPLRLVAAPTFDVGTGATPREVVAQVRGRALKIRQLPIASAGSPVPTVASPPAMRR